MTSRAYPHTATVYTRLAEAAGKARWKRTVVRGVRISETDGATRAAGGDRGASSAFLIVPARAMRGYVSPGAFASANAGWTIRPRDMVVHGCATDTEPPKHARTVSAVKAVRIGSGIHHLEAS